MDDTPDIFELAKKPAAGLEKRTRKLDNTDDLEDSVAAQVPIRIGRELPDLPIETFATYVAPLTQRHRLIGLKPSACQS